MQISRVLLVCDVKISQVGRKNLAVRFDTYQIGGENNCQNPSAAVDFAHKSTGAETPSFDMDQIVTAREPDIGLRA
jgi:hypothetical protein